jgi:ankyrin repeat protein
MLLRPSTKYLGCNFLGAVLLCQLLHAQGPAKIDFARDVQPIFQAHCIACHGPTQQMNRFRLDRRSDALRGGTISVIGPGNADASRLYLRLIGSEYGVQMPPTGALNTEQIGIIKAWIDQGAEWPDQFAGETQLPPVDPKARPILNALRDGDHSAFQKLVTADPQAANRKGPDGATPLMYAALYGTAADVRLLLEKGANANIRNNAGATALMWAVEDPEKVRLLLEHGADVKARSDDGRVPLVIAAGEYGSSPVVKLMLDHGADPSVKSSASSSGTATALGEAAYSGDETTFRMLIDHGADIEAAGPAPIYFAIQSNCTACRDLLLQSADRSFLNRAMILTAPPGADGLPIKMLLEHGADANTTDRAGQTILMLAASSDALPVESVKALLERGVAVNAKNAQGQTALDLAKLRGRTPIVDLLVKAGAEDRAVSGEPLPKPKPAGSPRAAVERSIPLLQRADVTFLRKSGCVSCHNNSLTAMSVSRVHSKGLPVNNEIASSQRKAIGTYIHGWRERVLQGDGIPGQTDTVSYILLGLAAANYPSDEATDALAYYVKRKQAPDGHWIIKDHRPPHESSEIQSTAVALRVLQVYGLKAHRADYDQAAQRGARWLENAQPVSTEDRTFQLLGLTWAAGNRDTIRNSARALLAEQRPDGGWAQIPTLRSDAYATGQALVALKDSGSLGVTDKAYQRGVQFLLNTQFEDGSWYVRTRSQPIMPLFDSDFPYGRDQWISTAATNWATMALASAAH